VPLPLPTPRLVTTTLSTSTSPANPANVVCECQTIPSDGVQAGIMPGDLFQFLRRCRQMRLTMSGAISWLIASVLFLALVGGGGGGGGRGRTFAAHGLLVAGNQREHTTLLVDPETRQELAKVVVGVNG